MKTLLAVAAIAVAVSGCATQRDPQKQALMNSTIPRCSTKAECDVMWSAARQWVLMHSGFKFQIMTDDYMETYNGRQGSLELSVRVNKKANADGSFQILGTVWCGNMFGCVIDPQDAVIDFNRSVSASASGGNP